MKKLLTLTAAILVLGAIAAHAEDAAPATETAPAAVEQTAEKAPAADAAATEETKKESFWSKLFGKKDATEESATGTEAAE